MIDVHTHGLPQNLPPLGQRYAGHWPELVETGPCTAELMLGERPFRWIDDRCWGPRRRLDDMDAEGVGRQVISPILVTFSYTLPAEGAAELARFQNEWIAGITREDPDRFSGLGTVPLQEPDVAAEMVVEIVTDLQLPGIEIGSNVGGRPTETAVAAAALVLGGVLDRHPTLRIVLAHGGGAFLALLTRIDRCTAMLPGITPPEHAPSEYARRFWYDTLVYDPDTLARMVQRVGSDRMMIGTDYPFPIAERPAGRDWRPRAWPGQIPTL